MSLEENQGEAPPGLTLTQPASTACDADKVDVQMADGSDYEPSEASSYDPAAALFDNISQPQPQPSKKRRQSQDFTEAQQPKKVRLGETDFASLGESSKLLVDRAEQLQPEIWQYIFSLVSPRDLGRLLAVNKRFRAFLTPFAAGPPAGLNVVPSCLLGLKPDAIWQASRRLFCPRMPAPLKGRTEVQMWRLVCSVSCQFCGSRSQEKPLPSNNEAWRSGPGPGDVCPIFPFCVFTCGTCLRKKGVKEIDLLLSTSFPSFLLPALPPVLVDAEMHVIPPRAMQTGAIPPDTQVTKLFWSEHVEKIKAEFEHVKALGSAAAEEWIKGLEIRGKQALADASRWEKWVGSGGIAQLRMPKISAKAEVIVSATSLPSKPPVNKTSSDNSKQIIEQQERIGNTNDKAPPAMQSDASNQQPRVPVQQKRTKEEVAQLKAQRRADIVGRAMLLDPPLTADTLARIPSFQAALQLITPLDDNAWELLKPRLLAQREEAELRAKQSSDKTPALQEKLTKESEKKPAREPRDVTDEEWDEIQGPVRARISEYANEIIEGWNNGATIKKKNCPQFAADVLLYVRKRFYAEVAKDTAAIVTAGKKPIVEPQEGPWTQRLTLENMKWVFDVKIKPHTESLRKELFLCNGCLGGNGIIKWFGFEGVLQHYAAKHTIALSLGNIVVHWRAEWPEVPPFCAEPLTKEKAYYDISSSNSLPSTGASIQQSYPEFQAGPTPGYAPPVYGVEAPPISHYNSGPPVAMPAINAYGQPGAFTYGVPYPSASYHDAAAYASYPHLFSSGMAYNPQYPAAQGPAPNTFDYGTSYSGHADTNDTTQTVKSQVSRVETIARTAQSIWSKVGTNKKIPPSVRAYVVIWHVANSFEDTYHENLPLTIFIDATSKNKKLRMIRALNGVPCKVCSGNSVFHLPQLVKHYKQEHVDALKSQGLEPWNWRTDMIKLPEDERLATLADKLKDDPIAYSSVKRAIPWVFEQAFGDESVPKPARSVAKDASLTSKPPTQETSTTKAIHRSKEHPRPDDAAQSANRIQQPERSNQPNQPQVAKLPAAALSRAQSDIDSEQDAPLLRPASEVYGSRKYQASAPQARSDALADTDASESNNYTPSDFGRRQRTVRVNSRGAAKVKNEYEREYKPMTRPQSGLAKPRDSMHWRDEKPSDYRDIREQRYSGMEPTHLRDRSASVGNRPRECRSQFIASANTEPIYVDAGRRVDHELSAFRNYHEAEEEVIYIDESGREIGRGRRARDTLPREHKYDLRDDRSFGAYGQSSLSWHGGHGPVRYREQSSQPRHAHADYHYEPPVASQRVYHDYHDARTPPEHPTEAYELVEVRHPDGDYFVRRAIRRDDRPYYVYETHPHPAEQNAYPLQRGMEGPSGYGFDPRANPPFPSQPTPRPDYNDYDPRYPVSTGEPPAYHGHQL
ncbi:hypothetical protein FHETE_6311 [Fusarium heterosporum]|uniref:DUF7892 domain-containing protein n=1 Tax=Fusarium heterosporum TaxID=42747 RepID=A0A8H5TAN2_FUSHE|nr:hypothetical protein FHETE_6311 [Fusarium heterosporum]